MNWSIGQEIVAIVNHSQGLFKEGDTFIVKGLKNSYCSCEKVLIDIGKTDSVFGLNWCPSCNAEDREKTFTIWFSEYCFRPLDELADITELTEILENTKPYEVK